MDLSPVDLSKIEDLPLREALEAILVNLQRGSQRTPVGTLLPTILQPKDVHDPWLVADGRTVSRARYLPLFRLIGVRHGSGDGSTSFGLPDYRGKFLYGTPPVEQATNVEAFKHDSAAADSLDRMYVTVIILGR